MLSGMFVLFLRFYGEEIIDDIQKKNKQMFSVAGIFIGHLICYTVANTKPKNISFSSFGIAAEKCKAFSG